MRLVIVVEPDNPRDLNPAKTGTLFDRFHQIGPEVEVQLYNHWY